MAKKYNHAFDIAFEVVTDKEDPLEVTAEELLEGLLARIRNIIREDLDNRKQWNLFRANQPGVEPYMSVFLEACHCYDTYEILEGEK